MHSSGSITRKFGPSWKQSTGQTSTQSVYLHLMQFSVTTKGMDGTLVRWRGHFSDLGRGPGHRPAESRKNEARASLRGLVGYGAPYGIRTRVLALRGPRPRPLDEGSGVSLGDAGWTTGPLGT